MAQMTNSRRRVSSKRRQRTARAGDSVACIGVRSLSTTKQKQYRLSCLEWRILRRKERKSQNLSIVWKRWKSKSASVAFRPLSRFRPIESQIQALIRQGLSHWYPETNHIYKAITQDHLQSKASVPGDLLAFSKYVRNGAVYQAWMKRSWRGKVVWWRHSLYYALLFSPSDALRIVADISKRTYLQIPGKTMSDALLILDASHLVANTYQEPMYHKIEVFHEAVCTYLKNYTKREGGAFLSWCIIRRLSRILQGNHLTSFIRSVMLSKTEYSIYTKLHAMYRYLQLGSLNNALELFKTFTKEELLNRAAQAFCITVLHKKWQVDDLHTLRRDLTVWFLRQGAVPDCAVRNVILQNYLESGDRQSAFSMLDSIRERGLATSDATYGIFLRHTAMEDTSTVNKLYEMALEDGVLPRSTFLADYFIQIAALTRFDSGQPSFSALLALYERTFDTTDLENFGILEPGVKSRLHSPSSAFTLRWMLASWIMDNRDNPEKLVSAYNNYQFHLRSNHPRIAKLASTTHIPTAFVFAFGQHKSHLHMCTKVLQDMLQPEKVISPSHVKGSKTDLDDPDVPDHERFLEPKTPSYARLLPLSFNPPAYRDWDIWESLKREAFSYKVAPPGARTWNALLTVLLQHNHYDAAEGVLRAMQEAGFEANEMTWNILIRGFAGRHGSLQNVVEEMRNNSSVPDSERTDSALWHAASLTVRDGSSKGFNTQSNLPDDDAGEYVGIPSLQGAEAEKLNDWGSNSIHGEMVSRL